MLYTLTSSSYYCHLKALIRIAYFGDALLLLSDGVTVGIIGSSTVRIICSSPLELYALENDVVARGLSTYISPNIKIIDYVGFVRLTEKHIRQIRW
ncbi:sulfurtransferase complex subunit TusB [Sodalis sp. CWE]|uniref:sulfurtransferase complex subunit TusB n=1 Tax=Sodalis sp. CWE TaxID=2803816 RepID=UPI001C7CFBCE|nr:sulfurtransferase complex subunit TusB [Sodalis sp. CWE]